MNPLHNRRAYPGSGDDERDGAGSVWPHGDDGQSDQGQGGEGSAHLEPAFILLIILLGLVDSRVVLLARQAGTPQAHPKAGGE